MDWSRFWGKIIILIILCVPNIVYAGITCNDGTESPTCYECHRGCCSGHDGCTENSNYNYNVNDDSTITLEEWYKQNDGNNDELDLDNHTKEKKTNKILETIIYLIFIVIPMMSVFISIILTIIEYIKEHK